MRSVIILWGVILLLKLLISAVLPLFHDETYYWVWSHHLSLSYFDHPGFVAWLFSIGHFLENFYHTVRWPAVLVGHLTLLVWLVIMKEYLEINRLKIFCLLAGLMPLLGPGSIVVTPDLPLMFFWSTSLLAFINYFRTPSILWSGLMGLSLGLGFSSKYHIVLFVPCALVYLIWSGQLARVSIRHLIVSLILFLAGAFPVIYWNLINDFISFKFQLHHGLGSKSWNPEWTVSYLLGQLILLFPIIFILAIKDLKSDSNRKLLASFALVPIIFFGLTSMKGRVEANWPIVAHPEFLALAVMNFRKPKWLYLTGATWLGLLLLVVSQVLFSWPSSRSDLKTSEVKEFDSILKIAHEHQPLYARTFQMASQLSYKLKRPIYKLRGMNRYDFYDQLAGSMPFEEVFFVVVVSGEGLPSKNFSSEEFDIIRMAIDTKYDLLEVRRL